VFLASVVGVIVLAAAMPAVALCGLIIVVLLVFVWRTRRWRDLDRRGRLFVVGGNFAAAVALLLAIHTSSNRLLIRYTVTELGTLGGKFTHPVGINNAGQVVGYSETAPRNGGKTGDMHAFLWQAITGMRDLGTLGGEYSRAKCINNKGQIVGSASTIVKRLGLETNHEFIWDSRRGMRDMNKLLDCAEGKIEVVAINDDGDIVGRRGESRGFLLRTDGRIEELPNIVPIAINNRGEVVGTFRYVAGDAVMLQASGVLRQLPTPGGEWRCISAVGMNDKGQVICVADNGRGGEHVFLWKSGVELKDVQMPALDSGTAIAIRKCVQSGEPVSSAIALGINNRGQVVGFYGPPEEPDAPQPEKPIDPLALFLGGPAKPVKALWGPPSPFFNAFIYEDGVATNLNKLIDPACGWHIEEALAINDLGQIVVKANNFWIDDNGNFAGPGAVGHLRSAALLLTPVP
jgi:probable HAF family extracellular repeat protein